MLKFEVLLPGGHDFDVVRRVLTVDINGATSTVEVGLNDTTYVFDAPQDAAVRLSLVDIDDGGNESTPSVREFVAKDVFPPAQPGELGLNCVGESSDPVIPPSPSQPPVGSAFYSPQGTLDFGTVEQGSPNPTLSVNVLNTGNAPGAGGAITDTPPFFQVAGYIDLGIGESRDCAVELHTDVEPGDYALAMPWWSEGGDRPGGDPIMAHVTIVPPAPVEPAAPVEPVVEPAAPVEPVVEPAAPVEPVVEPAPVDPPAEPA